MSEAPAVRQPGKRARPAPVPPPQLADLVSFVGPDLALLLIERRGGTRVHVPLTSGVSKSFLLDLLGEEPLQRLAKARGGCLLKMPVCREWRTRMYLHQGGRSHAEIARLVGSTESYVQKLAHTDWTPQPPMHKRYRARLAEQQTSFDLD